MQENETLSRVPDGDSAGQSPSLARRGFLRHFRQFPAVIFSPVRGKTALRRTDRFDILLENVWEEGDHEERADDGDPLLPQGHFF